MNRLRSILNIEFLIKEDAFRNWRMILFVFVLAIIMISRGHSADRKIFKIAALNSNIRLLKSDFIEGKKALSKNAKGKIISLLKKEPFVMDHNTGNSLEDTKPEAFSALTAKSSPRIPAVFLAEILLITTTSSIRTEISSNNAKKPEAIKKEV